MKKRIKKLLSEYRQLKADFEATGNVTDDPVCLPEYPNTLVDCIGHRSGLSGSNLGEAEQEDEVSDAETEESTRRDDGTRKRSKEKVADIMADAVKSSIGELASVIRSKNEEKWSSEIQSTLQQLVDSNQQLTTSINKLIEHLVSKELN